MNVGDILGIIVGGGVTLFFLVGIIWQYRNERRDWNGGVCPDCGTPWRSFTMDSQGGRGYNCETHCNSIWISYPGIDRELPGRYDKIQKA
jgi:hypothetical protein